MHNQQYSGVILEDKWGKTYLCSKCLFAYEELGEGHLKDVKTPFNAGPNYPDILIYCAFSKKHGEEQLTIADLRFRFNPGMRLNTRFTF